MSKYPVDIGQLLILVIISKLVDVTFVSSSSEERKVFSAENGKLN